ncbi:ABC transporter ATP-binding protein [Schlesneria paludicola]|uniref:ABC transporter ATP-binding protein n=1 Tax=Schlesneria paludicola TaxID=360056 RepID=UPI00029B1C60|nr:ABC transporter ATP-binding protein [Schlesneria paludicola]
MSDLAIRVEGLSKSFRLGHHLSSHRFTEFIENVAKAAARLPGKLVHSNLPSGTPATKSSDPSTFWALQDVSFEVRQGEVVGFVGRNGAGKSTLLKLLSRITYPTHGRIEIRGRVRSLLEVGTGFHQDLTGRENIFLNGAVMGMSRGEIRRKFDEIVAFAEVEKFLDTPVKYYSSGMYVRLAFSVAAHLEPEILIIDEVLAVGDAAFQQKCMGKMGAASRQGKTILIVSHSLAAVTALCDRAILLEGGRVTANGDVIDVVRQYMASMRTTAGEAVWQTQEQAPGNEKIRLHAVRILQEGIDGSAADVDISKEIEVQISYWNLIPDQQLYAAMSLKDANGTFVLRSSNARSVSSTEDEWYGRSQPIGLYHATCTIPGNFLNHGQYQVSIIVGQVPGRTIIEEDDVVRFDVHDTGAIHEDFFGNWSGPVIRPRLPWNTIQDLST